MKARIQEAWERIQEVDRPIRGGPLGHRPFRERTKGERKPAYEAARRAFEEERDRETARVVAEIAERDRALGPRLAALIEVVGEGIPEVVNVFRPAPASDALREALGGGGGLWQVGYELGGTGFVQDSQAILAALAVPYEPVRHEVAGRFEGVFFRARVPGPAEAAAVWAAMRVLGHRALRGRGSHVPHWRLYRPHLIEGCCQA